MVVSKLPQVNALVGHADLFTTVIAKIQRMRKVSGAVACVCLLVLVLVAPLSSKQKGYRAARQRAIEATDIFSSFPLQIHANFHIYALDGPVDGRYQYSQLSTDERRVDILSATFSESTLDKGGAQYVVRSRDLRPLAIWYLTLLIQEAHSFPSEALTSKATSSLQNGRAVTCFGTPLADVGDQMCFDVETGALASWEWTVNTDRQRLEYSNYQEVDAKFFPTKMCRFRHGKLLAEVEVDSISHEAPDPKLYVPPANASKQEICKNFQPADVEYSAAYFNIRSSFKSGYVVVGGSIDNRGTVQKTDIQESTGANLNEAALRALRALLIHPAKCDGNKVPAFFRFQIWFSPVEHSDSFQSFR